MLGTRAWTLECGCVCRVDGGVTVALPNEAFFMPVAKPCKTHAKSVLRIQRSVDAAEALIRSVCRKSFRVDTTRAARTRLPKRP